MIHNRFVLRAAAMAAATLMLVTTPLFAVSGAASSVWAAETSLVEDGTVSTPGGEEASIPEESSSSSGTSFGADGSSSSRPAESSQEESSGSGSDSSSSGSEEESSSSGGEGSQPGDGSSSSGSESSQPGDGSSSSGSESSQPGDGSSSDGEDGSQEEGSSSSSSEGSSSSSGEESSQSQEETAPEADPRLQVQWQPSGQPGEISLRAQLTGAAEELQVQALLALDKEEYRALQDPLPQGVARQADGEGGVLSVSLSASSPVVEGSLLFAADHSELTVTMEEGDLSVQSSGTEGGPVEWSLSASPLTVTGEYDWTIQASSQEEMVVWDGTQREDLAFAVKVAPHEENTLVTSQQTLELRFTLPEGYAFAQGAVPAQLPAQNSGGPVRLEGGEAFVWEELSQEDERTLVVRLAREGEEQEELPAQEMTVTVEASAVVERETPAPMAAAPAEEEPKPVTLNAVLRSVPSWGEEYAVVRADSASLSLESVESIQIGDFYKPDETSQTVYWIDNGNEENKRPAELPFQVTFTIAGVATDIPFDADHWKTYFGEAPMPEVTATGSGVVTIAPQSPLPKTVTYTDTYGDSKDYTVTWTIQPAEIVDGYDHVEVTPENADLYTGAGGNYGHYYVLLDTFTAIISPHVGQNEDNSAFMERLRQAVEENFQLHTDPNQVSDRPDFPLDELPPDYFSWSEDGGALSIQGLWRYTLDGRDITYTIEAQDEEQTSFAFDGMEDGDQIVFSYDNAGAPNHGSATDKLYSGGTLDLRLTGTTTFQATKEWLDAGDPETIAKRPAGTLELWRYKAEEGFQTAAPVRDGTGAIVSVPLDTQDNSTIFFPLDGSELEKYDADGNKYLYVVREYLNGSGSYEQVFGKVSEDGTIQDRLEIDGEVQNTTEPRSDAQNDFLYDGGTLSNRIVGRTVVKGEKVWDAAAFQAALSDVRIVLTLQARPAGSTSQDDWENTEVTKELTDFTAENMASQPVEEEYSRYDDLGNPLEFRWVETAVYQGKDSTENLLKDGTFTLQQDGRPVVFRSLVKTLEDGTTRITNSITDTITYDLEKQWEDKDGNLIDPPADVASITLALYRLSGNGTLEKDTVSYLTVTLDGQPEVEATPVSTDPEEEGVTVRFREDSPWHGELTGLPQYDENGRQYEYVLLESSGAANWFPTYTTTRDEEGNYNTIITNAPGEGHRIMVRKEWIDDGDDAHREPVTVGIYNRNTNAWVNTVTLGEDGVWQELVSIGELEPKEVYIRETQLGDQLVDYTDVDGPLDDPEKPYEGSIQVTGEHHRYEVTHLPMETIAGEAFYRVVNRRLGNVDLTVTKTWVDGDGELRQQLADALEEEDLRLALVLDFAEATSSDKYKMTRQKDGGDTINLGGYENVSIQNDQGQPAQSIQALTFNEDTTKYYFFNLPKYDASGTVVNYTVTEQIVKEDGTVVTDLGPYLDLAKVWDQYSTRYEERYDTGDHYFNDEQTVEVTNYLSATTEAQWHKEWHDQYAYQMNNRPDIYLDIYQYSPGQKTVEIYRENYRWTQRKEDQVNQWTAQLTGLPRYDDQGYEYVYYAVEKMSVRDPSSFDYAPVRLKMGGTDLGTLMEPTNDAIIDGSVRDISAAGTEAEYALRQDGTFVNTLEGNALVQGQKLWQNLPAQYPNTDLPTVTFTLYQSIGSVTPDNPGTRVATLTIEANQWSDLYTAQRNYAFQLPYLGHNVLEITGDGPSWEWAQDNTNFPTIEKETRLPRYDENGALYTYTLKETAIQWPSGVDQPDVDTVFEVRGDDNNFLVTNTYRTDGDNQGSLAVQKHLYLPMKADGTPEAYPAVRFMLTRWYKNNNGETVKDNSFNGEWVWTSENVKKAYDEYKKTDPGFNPSIDPLTKTLTFEGLTLYAPNASPYQYTVTEIKTHLNDYDTWVEEGDHTAEDTRQKGEQWTPEEGNPSISGLLATPYKDGASDPTPAATFVNRRVENTTKITLTGTKEWEDYEDAFHFRPESGEFLKTLKLYRYAPAQTGENNGIGSEANPLPVDDAVFAWLTEQPADDIWTYIVTGANGSLDRFAPNGMAWQYLVREEKVPHYQSIPENGQVGMESPTPENDVITMNPLTNSIQTSQSFNKVWLMDDGEGNLVPVTEDYLGYDLSVTFQLQVAEKTEEKIGTWQNADAYFAGITGVFPEGYQFSVSITGRIDDAKWGNGETFNNLPLTIKKGENTVNLVYRVVETEITLGNGATTYTWNATTNVGETYTYEGVSDGSLITPVYSGEGGDPTEMSSPAGSNHYTNITQYNKLATTQLMVAKTWKDDAHNAYGTRPETDRTGHDWEVHVVLQRKTEESDWTLVQEGASPLVVTVTGTNDQDTVTVPVAGLPASDQNGNTYTYRVRELSSDYQMGEVPTEAQMLEPGGSFYTAYQVTYGDQLPTATNTMATTTVQAEKQWNVTTEEKEPVTLTLQYQVGEDQWKDLRSVPLDGEADTSSTLPYCEDAPWHAKWTSLPKRMPGSYLPKDDSLTQYQVVEETPPDGYLQESANGENGSWTIVNVPAVQLTVEKAWGGVPAGEQQPVTVALWRTTDQNAFLAGSPGEGTGWEPVTDEQGKQRTLTLMSATGWTGTFDSLPKYSPDHKLYYYYVQETQVGGNPAADTGYDIYTTVTRDDETGNFAGKIVNVGKTDLTVTKTWVDNGNAYNTRPENLILTLERSRDGGTTWSAVTDVTQPPWGKNDTANQWTLTYEDLPAADRDGTVYTYRVTEALPSRGDGWEYVLSQNPEGTQLTNTLTGEVDVSVTKEWQDNGDAFDLRPEEVTIVLLQNGVERERVTLPQNGLLGRVASFLTGGGDSWSHTFEDLPKYDESGILYRYEVKEVEVPDYYVSTIKQDEDGYTFVVTNAGPGCLQVEKTVTGNRGDRSKPFAFTVEWTDEEGLPLTEAFPYTITRQDGSTKTGQIASGDTIHLRHGEQILIDGLPHGTHYLVTEGDNEGYQVTRSGEVGTIQGGVVSMAAFNNHRSRRPTGGGGDDDPPPPPAGQVIPVPIQPGEELPSTGQNWLLPLLLTAGGAAALARGICLYRKKRRDPHDR